MTTRITNALTILVAILVFLIGAGAFTLSYDALYQTGLAVGLPADKAWIWPLLIDTPLVVFTLALLIFQLLRQSVKLWAALVVLYSLVTVGFNLTHAVDTWLGWTVAIVAPVGLLLTTEAFRHLARTIIERQATGQSLAELTTELVSKRQRLNTLTEQVEQARALLADIKAGQVEALKAKEVSSIQEINTLNAAKQDKRQERLDTLLAYLGGNPQASLTQAAQEIGVSRQTTSAYVGELTQSGKLHRNGNGWEVTR